MSDLISWAIYGFAQAGEWLLAPAGLAAAWALYRLITRIIRRVAARQAETAAVAEAERTLRHHTVLNQARQALTDITNPETRPGDNTTVLAECEAIWQLNTRKENRP